jgi:apolipoprotein N-acyltransferase
VPHLQLHHLERVAAYTENALREARAQGFSPDAVLWPENLITRRLDEEIADSLRNRVQRLGVPVITGLVRPALGRDPNLYRSSVVWLGPTGEILDAVDKQLAVPLLESSSVGPIMSWLAFAFGGAARTGLRVEETRQSRPLQGTFSAAPVLCFEALFPALTASRRDGRTRVILNLADDGWVPGESATRQLTAAVRFRAIEQRLPLVRVAHGGLSVLVDEFGRIVEELPRHAYAVRQVTLQPSAPPGGIERAVIFGLPLGAFVIVEWTCAMATRITRRSRGGTS